MLFYPYYFDPFAILYPFFIVMVIIIIIAIIIIIILAKSIRKNLKESTPYKKKSYQPSQPPRSTQPIYRQPEKSESISPNSSESYCKFCGEKTAKDAAFCPNCGSKL